MVYAEVLVADSSFHGSSALTYHAEVLVQLGNVVIVPLQKKHVLGIVVSTSTKKPSFTTKAILQVPALPPLAGNTVALIQWMRQYYPYSLGAITQQFLPHELPKKEVEPWSATNDTISSALPPLTSEQEHVLHKIEPTGTHILHGETGTGKTRIYIELAKRALSQNRSSIILTPEIGLTSQLATTMRMVFGEGVVVLHSQLTEAVRRRLWVSILKEKRPIIVIGPRSALFSPVHNIGLIVLDEFHEPAYKQDKSPYYQTGYVAGKLASLANAPLILGSATPPIVDYYFAKQKQRPVLRMTQTATDTTTNETFKKIIDLRDRSQFTKKSHLSDILINDIQKTINNKEQVLLYLNRRGTARIILCDNCGWQALCPHCDLPLVYHNDTHLLRCHSCNYKMLPPPDCLHCHNTSVVFKSIGTKAIYDEVIRLFPEANVHRYDTDNTKEQRIEQHYEALHAGKVDIIVGTQTIAKGLDLPRLGLVGIIAADTSLYMPDFSAQERTYQLLSQVIGRVGRGHRAGRAIIQTYHPENPILQAIIRKDWDTFYNRELQERQRFFFPPFCFLLKVWCRRGTQQGAQRAATLLAKKLQNLPLKIIIEGPAPAFQEKISDQYQWQLIVKAKNRKDLIAVIQQLPAHWNYDIDPTNLL